MRFINKKIAFTLTEVLLAVAIVGVIAALVLPALVTKFQDDLLTQAEKRTRQSIQSVLDQLDITENKAFHNTMMYVENEPASYATNSGLFLKKYMRISKYCGDSNGNCFAKKYYQYENITRKEYTPNYKGACASLKDGSSICITPQVGENGRIECLLDINGPKGPNIYKRDLVEISFEPKSKITYDKSSDDKVYHSDVAPLTPEEDPCVEPNSLACCRKKAASINYHSPCCNYDEFKNTPKCYDPSKDPCYSAPFGFDCCNLKNPTTFTSFPNSQCCMNEKIADKYPAYCNKDVEVALVCQDRGKENNFACESDCNSSASNPHYQLNQFFCAGWNCSQCCKDLVFRCKLESDDKYGNYLLQIDVSGTQMYSPGLMRVNNTNNYSELRYNSAIRAATIEYRLMRDGKEIYRTVDHSPYIYGGEYGPFEFEYEGPVK